MAVNTKTSIKEVAETNQKLWSVDDLKELTGWSNQYISKLCTAGSIPYLPGKPYKFFETEVREALVMMQVGGKYGKKKKPKGATA